MWFVLSAYTSVVINSCQLYFITQIRLVVTSILTSWLTHWLTNQPTHQRTNQPTNRLHVWVLGKLTGPQSSPYFVEPQCLLPHSQGCKYTVDYLILKPMIELLSFCILLGLTICIYWSDILLHYVERHSTLLLMTKFFLCIFTEAFFAGMFLPFDSSWIIISKRTWKK
jgi:hypothetical protein